MPPGMGMKNIKRILGYLIKFYPVLIPIIIVCIVFSAITAAVPAIFQQKIFADISEWYMTGDWAAASKVIMPKVIILVVLYVISLATTTLQTQIMAFLGQDFLNRIRLMLFDKMQSLPLRYFDTNKHGDIMSRYTNDIDALRMLVMQALPSALQCGILLISVFCIMVYYSIWLTLVVLFGIAAMFFVTKKVGGGSAKYFMKQQNSIGKAEGFVQEMMSGQKVIKVFNHEDKCLEEFDKLNEELCADSMKANAYANLLGPIIGNIGNILYVLVALFGGLIIITKIPNIAVSAIIAGSIGVLTIDVMIPFLNMSRQFCGNVNQITQHINSLAMAMAAAARIFSLLDAEPESDEGTVTLVNITEDADGNITESEHRTGKWAWKVPQTDGTFVYVRLQGDVRLNNVDFGYTPEKTVLHDITLYAEPGQKVAFVGATGAGKTTITNLLNRFYDINDGQILYDGINVKTIHKSDLRRSLGLVLQDTNLFTGTVMDNIRYGKLDATDDECIQAAKLAGADDFITRLPDSYNTMLENNGENLSQGQRQLISIARAAVANPPVMILDEATSSIDTRTEQIVQRGMDKLMEGRTVFVIAHRLSTVRNSDVIMVLDQGKIIERGSHEQLIAEGGQYYQLYTGAFELE
ncbi:MAG: ABC transporter ATP-binding protein [Firmicutes bacterium]|nr:ABC transporter ATP-binding protein [Bacillota bacterium]